MEFRFDNPDMLIDRQAFDALSHYFPFRQRPTDELASIIYDRGSYIFSFENGWDILGRISIEELCQLSPFLLTQGCQAIHVADWKDPASFSSRRLLDFMRERDITPAVFLQYMDGFAFEALREESTQFITGIVHDLAKKPGSSYESEHAESYYHLFKRRYAETKEKLKTINKKEQVPFTLETILSFEHAPACLRYADDGRLYVLDKKGELHEFTENQRTNQWKLALDYYDLGRENMMLGDAQVFPNIAVKDRYVFVTNGSREVVRFDINGDPKQDLRYYPDAKCRTDSVEGYTIHDVVLRYGNVLLSMSSRHGRRYIGHWQDKIDIVYEGQYPRSFMMNNLTDYTLRLDVYNGHLFFPRNNGISLYRGFGSTGQKPKEMLEGYIEEVKSFGMISPITKFSFGEHFMVAQAQLKDFEVPMLCIFRPVYETGSTEVVPRGVLPPPSHLELEHVCYPPTFTGKTILDTSIAAHGKRFAMTNSDFNRVYVYTLN